MKSARYLLLALIPIFLLATSCPFLNLWSERAQPVNHIAPSAVPCIVTTGERSYPPTITRRPSEAARPGDTLTITFTSGHMVLPKCEKRDGKEYYQYPSMKELSETARTTIVQLDGKELTSVRCGHECQISFALPADMRAGKHTLTILPSGWRFNPRDTTFTIDVTR